MRRIRGDAISMIFQEPMTSLNPVLTIGRQIAEVLVLHRGLARADAHAARGRDAAAGAHPGGGAPRRAIPAPAFGRNAAAGHDRDGARLRAAALDRRRADHRARCDDSGADPRPDARAQGTNRRRDRADHARSRRGGGDGAARRRDVRRTQGRGSAGHRLVRTVPAIRIRAGCSIPFRSSALRARATR